MTEAEWKPKYEAATVRIVQLDAALIADKRRLNNIAVTMSVAVGFVGVASRLIAGVLVSRWKAGA